MADPFRSFSGKALASPNSASSEADPFLVALPDRDSITILMDETPLPVPDEIPDADEITEEEVASIGATAAEQPEGDVAGAPADASPDDNGGDSREKATDTDERDCFMGVLCLPKNITLIGHWAHELRLGNMSGRAVIGILAVGCAFALFLVLLAAFFRSDAMRGVLKLL